MSNALIKFLKRDIPFKAPRLVDLVFFVKYKHTKKLHLLHLNRELVLIK